MKIDIAICTWNRAALLKETLESIAAARVPDNCDVRVIVVNNNSTDGTIDTARSVDGIDLKLVHESQQGHTQARNRAIEAAEGELLIWTDDDVLVDHDWIAAYARAAESTTDSFWGGKIEPVFRPDPPPWIPENLSALSGCFAIRDLGDDPLSFSNKVLPYGANFAIRTSVQIQFPFDTVLGRSGDEVTGDDELDVMRRVLKAGHGGQWVPGCRVQHIITSERQTEDYVRRYFAGQGRAMVARCESWSNSRTKLRFQSMYESFAYRFKRNRALSPAWIAHLIRSGLAQGQLLALLNPQTNTERETSGLPAAN